MTGMSKKSLQIVVFGIIILLSIIIFSVLMSDMPDKKENSSDYTENNNNNNETDNSDDTGNSNENNNSDKGDYYYEFDHIKIKDICYSEVTNCDNIIGTVKVEEITRVLGLKYTNNGSLEYTISLDGSEFYKGKEDKLTFSEFISYEDKYLIIIFNKDNIENKLILLDSNGKKLLEDKYLRSGITDNNGTVSYKTLNCDLKDNLVYQASLKLINGKPKIVLGKSTGETVKDTSACN